MHTLARKLRHRRDQRAFDRAWRTASPSMRCDLDAAAVRQYRDLR